MSDDKNLDQYKSIKANTPNITTIKRTVPKQADKPGWLRRKYLKIKGAAGEFWVVGRYGFQLGGAAGLLLGFFVGGFESIRMKSIWPMPLAMIGSGFTFGCIFAISTVLRSAEDSDFSKISINKLAYEVVYLDNLEGKYLKKTLPFYTEIKRI